MSPNVIRQQIGAIPNHPTEEEGRGGVCGASVLLFLTRLAQGSE